MAKQLTLKELIVGVVEGFLVTATPFSVHDITNSIREIVNTGIVEVPALRVDGQAFKFEIGHDDVKFYFNELYQNGLFSKPLVRTFNGAYFIYEAATAAPPSKPINFATAAPLTSRGSSINQLMSALGGLRNATTIAVPSVAAVVQQAASSTLGRNEVVERVRQYLRNCKARGFTPSSKQIQSAIKRNGKSTGWSRTDLNQIRHGINNGSI